MRVQHPPLTFLTHYRTKCREFLGDASFAHGSTVPLLSTMEVSIACTGRVCRETDALTPHGQGLQCASGGSLTRKRDVGGP